jgi:hypothetical protein
MIREIRYLQKLARRRGTFESSERRFGFMRYIKYRTVFASTKDPMDSMDCIVLYFTFPVLEPVSGA